ncbi:helix-turn-helix transcriptional regulator [Paenibacillus aestuarii]|uniref:AraC family transcriptional regulator n=1 Tax=Paenibacillus aestuarii TaxID=516965 RepID=A0ABW0K223_9BACL|nr:AraC family transcriptional regulator [Paenibacillus aestuarii]
MREYTHEYADNYYHTPSSLDKMGGIVPIRIGHNIAKPNYRIGPRFIVYYSFHFIISGQVTFCWDENQVTLSPGELFCLFPHMIHEYYVNAQSEEEPLRMFWIAVEGKQLPALVKRFGLSTSTPYLKLQFDEGLVTQLFELIDIWKESATQDNLRLTSSLYLIFSRMLQIYVPQTQGKSSEHWIERSLEYMQLYYTEGISVNDVAQHVGVHRTYLSNIFQNKVGVRPHKYLKDLVMSKAMNSILETQLSVTQIALSLGYSDLYAFTHAFTNYFGRSPNYYRSALRKGVVPET